MVGAAAVQLVTDMGSNVMHRALFGLLRDNLADAQSSCLDLVIAGVEVSLWAAQQFAADLQVSGVMQAIHRKQEHDRLHRIETKHAHHNVTDAVMWPAFELLESGCQANVCLPADVQGVLPNLHICVVSANEAIREMSSQVCELESIPANRYISHCSVCLASNITSLLCWPGHVQPLSTLNLIRQPAQQLAK